LLRGVSFPTIIHQKDRAKIKASILEIKKTRPRSGKDIWLLEKSSHKVLQYPMLSSQGASVMALVISYY
jgi:hypothetical protein